MYFILKFNFYTYTRVFIIVLLSILNSIGRGDSNLFYISQEKLIMLGEMNDDTELRFDSYYR